MRLVNRKARQRYETVEEVEAGVVLTGVEVKSLRAGRGSISESYVKIKDGEAWVINMVIPAYQGSREDYDPGRTRKLLLHRHELLSLAKKMEGKNLGLVPVACYFSHNVVKIKIGLVRGKKQYEKKEDIKQRDLKRELRRQFKEAQLK